MDIVTYILATKGTEELVDELVAKGFEFSTSSSLILIADSEQGFIDKIQIEEERISEFGDYFYNKISDWNEETGCLISLKLPPTYEVNLTKLEELEDKADGIVNEVCGDGLVNVNDSDELSLRGLRLFGKTIQDGTPTPEAPIEFESVGELITISVTDGNEQTQSMFVMTPDGLRGIPALSDNAYVNYTDENGKKWICDEIDFERGVYIQRIYEDTVSIASVNTLPSGLYYGVWNVATTNKVTQGNIGILSTVATPVLSSATRNEGCVYENSANIIFVGSTAETLETMKEKYNGTKVLYVLKEPIETPLTAEQIEAFKALHSYYPSTTVTTDEGAGLRVKYNADTKLYIDNKFAEIQNLILQGG